MKIRVFNRQKDLSFKAASARSVAKAVLNAENVSCEELSLYFVTERAIARLHGEFFQDPTPTDCITFPIDKDYLGDLFVCPGTALRYAKRHETNPYEETALYIVHGILHLLGYDDLDPAAKRLMRKKEKTCMALLKQQGVLLRP